MILGRVSQPWICVTRHMNLCIMQAETSRMIAQQLIWWYDGKLEVLSKMIVVINVQEERKLIKVCVCVCVATAVG